MTKVFLTAAIIFTVLAGTALASYPPIRYGKSRVELAQSCALLGNKGESWGLDRHTGAYGCRNTENGNASTAQPMASVPIIPAIRAGNGFRSC
jgi:hypothetical protein